MTMVARSLRSEDNRAERVQPDALLMELPEISEQDWELAATQYLAEAGQLSFFLRQQANEVEVVLDQADVEIERGDEAAAKSLLRSAWTELREVRPTQGLHACVRAGLLASRIGDQDLCGDIIPNVTQSLHRVGLTDVAVAIESYDAIAHQFGDETAYLLRLGSLARVNAWAMGSARHEEGTSDGTT